jgi:hypothetical protein
VGSNGEQTALLLERGRARLHRAAERWEADGGPELRPVDRSLDLLERYLAEEIGRDS